MVSFFCVLAPEGMNVIVFGERGGEDADEHLKHSDYRADGIWYGFFFRLSSLMNEIVNYSFSIPRDIYFLNYCLRVFQILTDVLPP